MIFSYWGKRPTLDSAFGLRSCAADIFGAQYSLRCLSGVLEVLEIVRGRGESVRCSKLFFDAHGSAPCQEIGCYLGRTTRLSRYLPVKRLTPHPSTFIDIQTSSYNHKMYAGWNVIFTLVIFLLCHQCAGFWPFHPWSSRRLTAPTLFTLTQLLKGLQLSVCFSNLHMWHSVFHCSWSFIMSGMWITGVSHLCLSRDNVSELR